MSSQQTKVLKVSLHHVAVFPDIFNLLHSLILTVFWLCLFKRVHQSADCFQDKDDLSHLLPERRNVKDLQTQRSKQPEDVPVRGWVKTKARVRIMFSHDSFYSSISTFNHQVLSKVQQYGNSAPISIVKITIWPINNTDAL